MNPLEIALLLGLASAGAAMLARLVIGDLLGRLDWLIIKPASCDGCMASWTSAGGTLWLLAFTDLRAPVALVVAGAAFAVSVLLLKIKTRLET